MGWFLWGAFVIGIGIFLEIKVRRSEKNHRSSRSIHQNMHDQAHRDAQHANDQAMRDSHNAMEMHNNTNNFM